MSGPALDFILAALLAVGAWRGMATGALRQIVGLVGAIVAVWLAALTMRPMGTVVVTAIGVPEALGPIVGFALVFAVIVLMAAVVTYAARKVLVALRLGILDRAGGALLGAARTAVMISVFLLITSQAVVPGSSSVLISDDTRTESALHDPMVAVAPGLWAILVGVAPGLHEALTDRFQGFNRDP